MNIRTRRELLKPPDTVRSSLAKWPVFGVQQSWVWSSTRYLTSLDLNFLIYKTGAIMGFPPKIVERAEWNNAREGLAMSRHRARWQLSDCLLIYYPIPLILRPTFFPCSTFHNSEIRTGFTVIFCSDLFILLDYYFFFQKFKIFSFYFKFLKSCLFVFLTSLLEYNCFTMVC